MLPYVDHNEIPPVDQQRTIAQPSGVHFISWTYPGEPGKSFELSDIVWDNSSPPVASSTM